MLRDADPDDKAEVYRQLGLRLTYLPETQTVRAKGSAAGQRFLLRYRDTKSTEVFDAVFTAKGHRADRNFAAGTQGESSPAQ